MVRSRGLLRKGGHHKSQTLQERPEGRRTPGVYSFRTSNNKFLFEFTVEGVHRKGWNRSLSVLITHTRDVSLCGLKLKTEKVDGQHTVIYDESRS